MSLRSAALVALAVTSALALAASANAQDQRGRGGDTDGDGKISLQEFLAQRGRIFDRIDANHDGQITKEEIAAFQTRMENASAGAMIRSGKERRGDGGTQVARLAELAANGPVTRAQWDAMLTKRFQRLDTAGTGYITVEQMHAGRRGAEAATPNPPMSAEAPKS